MKIKFSPLHEYAKFFPPVPVKETIPDWYKKMKPVVPDTEATAHFMNKYNMGTTHTAKKCVPMMDYLTSGYALKTPVDILFSLNNTNGFADYEYRLPTHQDAYQPLVGSHQHLQMPVEIEGEKKHYIKLYAGWKVETPKGYSSLIYPNYYQFEKRFTLFPAIIDTDKYDAQIGSIGILHGNVGDSFKIDAGTVMLTVFPFKRDEWKMEIDDKIFKEPEQSSAKARLNQLFEGAYRKFFYSKKSYS